MARALQGAPGLHRCPTPQSARRIPMRRLLPLCLLLAMAVPQACQRDEVTAPRTSAAAGGAAPSAARIAFVSTRDGNREIYVMASDGSAQTRLTNVPEWDYEPSWSPDGNRIAFVSQRGRCDCLYVMAPDGSAVTTLTRHDSWWGDRRPTWAPDGQAIVFTRFLADNVDVYRIAAGGSAETALTHTPFHHTARDPQWSPDGSRIAFSTSQDGDTEIYVMNADGSVPTRLTNTPGDNTDPSWSPAYRPSSAPAHVDFTAPPPATVNANAVISPAIQITVTDASWSRVPGGVVRLEIGTSPASGATLSGTTQAKLVDGVATFNDLRIDQPGRGYTLVAPAGPAP